MFADVLALLAAVAFPVVVAGLMLLAARRDACRDARRARRRGGRHRKLVMIS